jgi:EPS-associated MarR family transcriptional regulator
LRLLGAHPELSQRELASSLGISLGKVNSCLRVLIDSGFLKAESYRSRKHKLAYLYVLTPAGIAAKTRLTRQFLDLKMGEYRALGVEIERLQRESEESADTPQRAALRRTSHLDRA